MITANKIRIEPTIFPDRTSQVWKLPRKLRDAWEVSVVWDFEEERELIDLLSLRRLLYSNPMSLHMPFMPYARQDKKVLNSRTFNLEVFADLLNGMRLSQVSATDVHNPLRTKHLIKNFRNIEPKEFHREVFTKVHPDCVVFPDEGASKRYKFNGVPVLVLEKERISATGQIARMTLGIGHPHVRGTILIVDDLVDGGATFIMCAKALREINPEIEVHLAVTHGIFSRGVKPLIDEEITIHCHYFLKRDRGV